jgi:hypothetical protein
MLDVSTEEVAVGQCKVYNSSDDTYSGFFLHRIQKKRFPIQFDNVLV